MSATRYKPKSAISRRDNEVWGDLDLWNQLNGEDNSWQMERLRRNLRKARDQELTPRQREIVHLHYDLGLSISEIARQQGIHKSSVSRTLHRGRERLKNCLKYSW